MSTDFSYEKKKTYLGEVAVPKVTVDLLTKEGYRRFKFLVDTGADCIMLPRYVAEYIGIDLNSCEKKRSKGIEGRGIDVYLGKIQIKFCDVEFKARCLFSARDDTPFLLGRMDILDRFDMKLDNKRIRFVER